MRIFPCPFPYGKALFYFGTQQCVPCKTLEPVLLELEDTYDHIPFYRCDITDGNLYRNMFSVMSVPTTILFDFRKSDRIELERLVGCYPKDKYIDMLNKHTKE